MPWKLLFNLLSPGGRNGSLSVLIFHRVPARMDPLLPDEPDGETFRDIMTWLAEKFNVLPLPTAIRAHSRDELPPRAISITFDDGYADNCTVAMPILQELGLNATFFIASGFLDGGCMWNDVVIESVRRAPPVLDLADLSLGEYRTGTDAEKRQAIDSLLGRLKYLDYAERSEKVGAIAAIVGHPPPRDLMLSSQQVIQMREAGMTLGAHTLTHPILARLPADQAHQEIQSGKIRLEEILGEPIRLFAYPNGKPGSDYLPEHVGMVRDKGFDAAVSTSPGVLRSGGDAFEIPRFTPWRKSTIGFGAQLARNMSAKARP